MLGNLNGMLGMLGLPSLEEFIDNVIDNPTNYTMVVYKITHKGKNRTFKNKSSRKRIMYKTRVLNTFSVITRMGY